MSTTTITSNKFAGACGRCGAKVPANAGLYVNGDAGDGLLWRGALHVTEADCKTTTKTWATFESRRRHMARLAELDAPWIAAGGTRPAMTHVQAPSYGSAFGCQVIIAPSWTTREIEAARVNSRREIRVIRGGMTIGKFTEPDRSVMDVDRETEIVEQVRQIAGTA